MSLTLASAWPPRGELPRFQRLLPELLQVYERIVITLPPEVEPGWAGSLRDLDGRVSALLTPQWAWGRYLALQVAAESACDAIQYADFDRLLRWVETRPDEWRAVAAGLGAAGCTIVGRSPAAYATHPRCLVETEAISNRVISHLLGLQVDASAGSKGFSRPAAAFILANSQPGKPFGVDAEWPILAQRGGFRLQYLAVEGLDWESADRWQAQAAGSLSQQQAAAAYDADPAHWAYRVGVAHEIVQAAYRAHTRPLQTACAP